MKPPAQPLSSEQLADIRERRKDDPEVIALLWEIWRYRIIAVKAHALVHSITGVDETRTLMIEDLKGMLESDPAVIKHKKWKDELLAPYRSEKKRK